MRTLLAPFALLYDWGLGLRRSAYRRGWVKVQRLDRPVISVGNLTVGGSGKTPLVVYIAQRLLREGWKPSILTRGYGRQRGKRLIVLEPQSECADPREVGDEPALLIRKLPDVPIVVCANRYQAGCIAEKRFGVDVHLLDDGFQHVALARDIDVVAVDVTQEFSDRALLPVGRQRERCSAIKRAHLVLLTRVDLADPQSIEERVRQINPQARIFHSSTKLCGLIGVLKGHVFPPAAFASEPVYAFCGIGNPAAFFADLKSWGFTVVGSRKFRDHHVYKTEDFAKITRLAKEFGAKVLITTEKDAMNLKALIASIDLPVYACAVQTEIRSGQAFEEALMALLENARVIV